VKAQKVQQIGFYVIASPTDERVLNPIIGVAPKSLRHSPRNVDRSGHTDYGIGHRGESKCGGINPGREDDGDFLQVNRD
jgi:hypothetical protein